MANLIERTLSAVAWKLSNLARLDPQLQERGIAGASHGSKKDVEVWEEFNDNWEELAFESERLIVQLSGRSLGDTADFPEDTPIKEGEDQERLVRTRVNQSFFRSAVLAAYENKCCITGLPIPELLTASHIVPWSLDRVNRLNPRNGLCLNALHDRAFDRGLITITPDYRVKLSNSIEKFGDNSATSDFLTRYGNKQIALPTRFAPDVSLLERHNKETFRTA